jgi:hypothetical protein
MGQHLLFLLIRERRGLVLLDQIVMLVRLLLVRPVRLLVRLPLVRPVRLLVRLQLLVVVIMAVLMLVMVSAQDLLTRGRLQLR